METLIAYDATPFIVEVFGEGWRVDEQLALNSRDDVRVQRLHLRNGTAQRAVILKHRLCLADADLHFIAECAHYVFFESLGDAFSLRPKFFGRQEDVFLLEDLGVDQYQFKNDTEIVAALAETFAQLHAATAGREEQYNAIRASFGLPDGRNDQRRYGETGCRREAVRGANFFLDRIGVLHLGFEDALRDQLFRAIELICNPQSPFRTFVHDDLADRRQSITIDGRVHLIDFELSKYFHAFIDLAKLLIGKVEMDHDRGGMRLNHPHLPNQLSLAYRARRAALGTSWSDDQWNENFGAAMIVQALMTIQRMNTEGGFALLHTMTATLKAILARLEYTLGGNPAYVELLGMLGGVQGRIVG
jgi:hypothetical protein